MIGQHADSNAIFSTHLDAVMQLFELVQTLFELFERRVEFVVIPRQLRAVSYNRLGVYMCIHRAIW